MAASMTDLMERIFMLTPVLVRTCREISFLRKPLNNQSYIA